jgi:hypothetical protein
MATDPHCHYRLNALMDRNAILSEVERMLLDARDHTEQTPEGDVVEAGWQAFHAARNALLRSMRVVPDPRVPPGTIELRHPTTGRLQGKITDAGNL